METITQLHPKDQIVEFMNRIYQNAMTTTSGGNLSILDSDGNMWISPGSVDKGTLRREDIVCVKADGSIEGRHKPSCEYPFHSAIYHRRPDVSAILHAHSPALVSYSIIGGMPDTNITPLTAKICQEPGFAPYAVPGSEALGEKISTCFSKMYNTILLENHGTCNAGISLMQAYKRFETLDFCARMLLGAKHLGKVNTLSAEQLAAAYADRNTEFSPVEFEVSTSAEREIRAQMVKLIRRAYSQKLFTSVCGTYAARVNGDTFIITPEDTDRATIEESDLILVKGYQYESGKNLPDNAWFIKQVFDARKEFNSLIIAAPPSVMAYNITDTKFDPRVIPESYLLLREMPSFEFGAYYNSNELLDTLTMRNPIVMVKNDCIISSGRTLLESFDRLEVAEYSARATIAAVPFGGMKPMNSDQVAEIVEAFNLIP